LDDTPIVKKRANLRYDHAKVKPFGLDFTIGIHQ